MRIKKIILLIFIVLYLAPTVQAQVIIKVQVYIKQHSSLESVFHINENELDISQIPVIASTWYVSASIWNRIGSWKNDETIFTDSRGKAEIIISPKAGEKIYIYVNNGSSKKLEYTHNYKQIDDGTVSTKASVGHELKLHANISLNLNPLYLNGTLLDTKKSIHNLVSQIKSKPYKSISILIDKLKQILSPNTLFVQNYPHSAKNIESRYLQLLENQRKQIADKEYKDSNYKIALQIYTDLIDNFPNSTSLDKYKVNTTNIIKNINNASIVDSVLAKIGNIPDNVKKFKTLKRAFSNINDNNTYKWKIENKLNEINREIEIEKDEKRITFLKSQDEKAIKKYKVDKNITQLDFFANPFAFIGKYFIITSTVKKFETPKSAFMQAYKQFYANFKIKPPKKFGLLNLIVKGRGVKTVINAYGTKIKIPFVDVVYILNFRVEN